MMSCKMYGFWSRRLALNACSTPVFCVTLSPFPDHFKPYQWLRLKGMACVLQGYPESLIKRKKIPEVFQMLSVILNEY